jgi:flagellar basal body-associated protein FliL
VREREKEREREREKEKKREKMRKILLDTLVRLLRCAYFGYIALEAKSRNKERREGRRGREWKTNNQKWRFGRTRSSQHRRHGSSRRTAIVHVINK